LINNYYLLFHLFTLSSKTSPGTMPETLPKLKNKMTV